MASLWQQGVGHPQQHVVLRKHAWVAEGSTRLLPLLPLPQAPGITTPHSSLSLSLSLSTMPPSGHAQGSRRRGRSLRQQAPPTPRRGGRETRPVLAAAEGEGETYQGVYGAWKVEDSDRVEVLLYRAGLNVASLSLVAAALPALLPLDLPSPASGLLPPPLPPIPLDALFWTGSCGLGLSLLLIHIYVTPIKRTLQALWLAGAVGAAALAGNTGPESSIVLFVLEHPSAVWAVGPLFAALTGLAFKEGLCYGKLEAALLVLVIPTLLIGHLSGLLNSDLERPLLLLWVLLSLVFSLRKFTQPIKDDIGDKSVFLFQALPREEQEKLIAKLNLRGD